MDQSLTVWLNCQWSIIDIPGAVEKHTSLSLQIQKPANLEQYASLLFVPGTHFQAAGKSLTTSMDPITPTV